MRKVVDIREKPIVYKASNIKPTKLRYLRGDFFPEGKLCAVAGNPNEGKSLLSYYLTGEMTRKKRHTILSEYEDTKRDMLRPRLDAAKVADPFVHLYNPHFPEDIEDFERVIKQFKAKVAILNPLHRHLGTSLTSPKIADILGPIHEIAERNNCTIIAISHLIKSYRKGQHPLMAFGGVSGGLTGTARACYIFAKHPDPAHDGDRVLSIAKTTGRMADSLLFGLEVMEHPKTHDEVPYLVDKGTTDITAWDLVTGPASGALNSGRAYVRQNAAEWLKHILEAHGGAIDGRIVKEEAEGAGISERTLVRAGEEISVVKTRKSAGRGKGMTSIWSLPQNSDNNWTK